MRPSGVSKKIAPVWPIQAGAANKRVESEVKDCVDEAQCSPSYPEETRHARHTLPSYSLNPICQ